jgi:hypothetical protein
VLEVIEYQQHPLRGEEVRQAGVTRPHRLADRGQHQFRVLQRCKRHEVDAVEEVVCECRRHTLAEPRLTDTGRARYCQQPHVVAPQQVAKDAHLTLAPDEAGEGERQMRAAASYPRRAVSSSGGRPPGRSQLGLIFRR